MVIEIIPLEKEHLKQLEKAIYSFWKPSNEKDAKTIAQEHIETAKKAITDPKAVFLVAVEGKKLVGFTSGDVKGKKGSSAWTYSFKPKRKNVGTGLGLMLFKEKVKKMRELGATKIEGTVISPHSKRIVEKTAWHLKLDLKLKKIKKSTYPNWDFTLKNKKSEEKKKTRLVPLEENHLNSLAKGILNFHKNEPNERMNILNERITDAIEHLKNKKTKGVFLVAVKNTKIVGFGNTFLDGKNWKSGWTYSFEKPKKGKKGSGLGTLLFEEKIRQTIEKGARTIKGTAASDAARKIILKTSEKLDLDLIKKTNKFEAFTLKVKKK
ncbi:MAG: hypothetical protein ABH803_00010 [Candidatus Micrarchaeota archaeon]